MTSKLKTAINSLYSTSCYSIYSKLLCKYLTSKQKFLHKFSSTRTSNLWLGWRYSIIKCSNWAIDFCKDIVGLACNSTLHLITFVIFIILVKLLSRAVNFLLQVYSRNFMCMCSLITQISNSVTWDVIVYFMTKGLRLPLVHI